MAIDVEELILEPFKEVIERGKEAADHAGTINDEDPELSRHISKSARTLTREGERALKRIQPLWDTHVDKYGDDFRQAIRDNDHIAEKRRTLEDLLYDFEDYMEPDCFDPEKFTELQAATKSFALGALDIIKRLKIDDASRPKSPTPSVRTLSSPQTHSFPPLPPLPTHRSSKRQTSQSSRHKASSRPNTRSGSGATVSPTNSLQSLSQFLPPPPVQSSHDGFLGEMAANPISYNSVRSTRRPDRHRQDTASPWNSSVRTQNGRSFPLQPAEPWSTAAFPQPSAPLDSTRQRFSAGVSDYSGQAKLEDAPAERRPSSPDILNDHINRLQMGAGDSAHDLRPNQEAPYDASSSWSRATVWVGDQDDEAAESCQCHSRPTSDYPQTPSSPRRISMFDVASPASTHRTSFMSDSNQSASSNLASRNCSVVPSSETRSTSLRGELGWESSGHIDAALTPTNPTLPPVGEHDDGLMLAEETTIFDSGTTRVSQLATTEREAACLIGAKSSFHELKGFCEGARVVRKHGHDQGWRQASAYGEATKVGRCTHCEFYQIHKEMILDFEKDVRANFMRAGVVHRLRFLFKSHMTVKNLSEIRFACLFCLQLGHTVREGDATVFQTQEALFRHISRHPQPLPEVAGIKVLYGKVANGHDWEEDYDIHLPGPPASNPMPEMALSTLPAATAIKSHARRYGEKPLADPDGNEDVLRFLTAARIVGIEFPEKWGGKWCIGWHDGVKGPFPLKHVEIEAPRQSEISLQSSGGISATVKWKWNPKDSSRAGWLSIDKGDVIRNIGWVYHDHWCWSGTNSKGKFGVFPSSHMDRNSVKEGVFEAKKPSKGGGLFGMRRRSISTEAPLS